MNCNLSIVTFVALFSVHVTTHAADYGKASEIKSARQGDVVVRYIKEYGSPCLDVQVLDPNKKWALISERNFCSYEGKSFLTEVSYAAFEKPAFATDGLHFSLSITPLELTEEVVRSCVIPVEGSVINDISCSDATDQ